MKQFLIYHAVTLKSQAEVYVQREFVCEVNAETLDAAFIASQNEFNEAYRALEIRSTCIGDIIQDKETTACYIIMERGYQSVSKDILNYIDWGYKLNDLCCIKQLPNAIPKEYANVSK